jgi:hypothetical protein
MKVALSTITLTLTIFPCYNVVCIILETTHERNSNSQLLVVIGTDCTGEEKSNVMAFSDAHCLKHLYIYIHGRNALNI